MKLAMMWMASWKELHYLRDEVKALIDEDEKPWPPVPEDLDQEYLQIPTKLIKFYNVLMSVLMSVSNDISARRTRLAQSFAQDCMVLHQER